MKIDTLETKIAEQIIKASGLDLHRDYLGISKISDCPRVAVREYRNGITATEQAYRMSFAGYEQERSVIGLLDGIITQINLEVVAPFDGRFKGHVDAVSENSLIEIKSVSVNKFQKVIESGRALRSHFLQVQLYMRYGGWVQTFIIYRCRETYEHKIIRVPYIQAEADKLEAKAKRILACIDSGEMPPCECGRCR